MSDLARRAIFLEEMGVGPLWLRRAATATEVAGVVVEEGSEQMRADASPHAAGPTAAVQPQAAAPVAVPLSGAAAISEMDWGQLEQAVAECTRCGLCEGRHRTVFGVGDRNAQWLFVGEGPGRNEDQRGEPFVGPAGKLLDNMLAAMGLRRGENAYIANIVKCRPVDENGRDRPPSPEEVAACMPYLERQIALVRPQVIVALGKTAALSLLGRDPDTPVSRLRGTVHRYRDLPLIVTYHPAYLLRNMADKKKAWADLCLAMNAHAGTA